MSIDRKFKINAVSIASGNIYDESSAVCFLAKDKAFLLTLPTYLEKCREVGSGTGSDQGCRTHDRTRRGVSGE